MLISDINLELDFECPRTYSVHIQTECNVDRSRLSCSEYESFDLNENNVKIIYPIKTSYEEGKEISFNIQINWYYNYNRGIINLTYNYKLGYIYRTEYNIQLPVDIFNLTNNLEENEITV